MSRCDQRFRCLDRIEVCYHAGERYGEPLGLSQAAARFDSTSSSRAEYRS